MILSNTAIIEALADGRLDIVPAPTRFDTSALDLSLGGQLQIPRTDLAMVVDLRRGNVAATLASISTTVELDDRGFLLEPRHFVLGQTAEAVTFALPDAFAAEAVGKPCLAGRVEGKSSRARFGLLVHFTAPTIHAGWSGRITLEMMNLGPAPILLHAGMPICQLIVEAVVGTPFASPSSFQGQRTPAGEP